MARDNGPLESYDRITFNKFAEIADKNPEAGIGKMGMWGIFDSPIEETGLLSDGMGKVWYEELVGGLRRLGEDEGPREKVFGLEFGGTWRINTQVYLAWYVVLSHPDYPILLQFLSSSFTLSLVCYTNTKQIRKSMEMQGSRHNG